MAFPIIDSLLLSASLVKIIGDFITKYGYLDKITILSAGRLIDYLDFPVFFVLALVLLIIYRKIHLYFNKQGFERHTILIESTFLLCYFLIFLQSYFVSYSGKDLLIFIAVVYIFNLFFRKFLKPKSPVKFNNRIFLNGAEQ